MKISKFMIVSTSIIIIVFCLMSVQSSNNNSNKKKVSFNNINDTVIFDINSSPQSINSLDRIYNPLRYPYRNLDTYKIPFQVIGCGARSQPCVSDSIMNYTQPNIISGGVAPVSISTQGPIGQPQQVGVIYKPTGDKNEIHPLYGRRKWANSNEWEYYTMLTNYGLKLKVHPPHKNYELSTNDQVTIDGYNDLYTTTIYDVNSPQYIPYV